MIEGIRLCPARLARARLENLGIIRSRAQTIRDLARAVLNGDIRFDTGQLAGDFHASLTAVRGIGDWTAQYLALRYVPDPDRTSGQR